MIAAMRHRSALSCLLAASALLLVSAPASGGQNGSGSLKQWYQNTGRGVESKLLVDVDRIGQVNSTTPVTVLSQDCTSFNQVFASAGTGKPPPGTALAAAYTADLDAASKGFLQCTSDITAGNAIGAESDVKQGLSAVTAVFKLIGNARHGIANVSLPTATAPLTTAIPLSGSGQSATAPFSVKGGLTVFTAQCSCAKSFSVKIARVSGGVVDSPINAIGSYIGSVAEGLRAGRYILNVTADAPWTVNVTQPRNVPASPAPHTYVGTGQQVVGPFTLSGQNILLKATNTSTDGAVFLVSVIAAANGSRQDAPFSEIGRSYFSGSTIAALDNPGPYYFSVKSDGSWTLAASQANI